MIISEALEVIIIETISIMSEYRIMVEECHVDKIEGDKIPKGSLHLKCHVKGYSETEYSISNDDEDIPSNPAEIADYIIKSIGNLNLPDAYQGLSVFCQDDVDTEFSFGDIFCICSALRNTLNSTFYNMEVHINNDDMYNIYEGITSTQKSPKENTQYMGIERIETDYGKPEVCIEGMLTVIPRISKDKNNPHCMHIVFINALHIKDILNNIRMMLKA